MNPNQQDFTRSLKGAPASVLLVLLLTGHTMTNQQLQDATGYSDKPVAQAVRLLQQRKLVQYNGTGNGWSIAQNTQLQLPFFETQPDNALLQLTAPSYSPHPFPNPGHPATPAPYQESHDLLVGAGVAPRSKTLTAILEHVPAALIKAHVETRRQLLSIGKQYPVSHLIRKLLDGDELPSPDCLCNKRTCPACNQRRLDQYQELDYVQT